MFFQIILFQIFLIISYNIKFTKQNGYKIENTDIFIQKVGAFPEIKVIPDSIITKYFSRETNTFYYKGLNALNQNFGIGAFAYFRRIIEKELINIISDYKIMFPLIHTRQK